METLKAADVDDRIRAASQTIYQALIKSELTVVIERGPHERTPERTNLRNGHRSRVLTTVAGDLELQIPKLRVVSFFPSLLRRRASGWPRRRSTTSRNLRASKRFAVAVIDVVCRKWFATVVSAEDSSTQLEVAFNRVLPTPNSPTSNPVDAYAAAQTVVFQPTRH